MPPGRGCRHPRRKSIDFSHCAVLELGACLPIAEYELPVLKASFDPSSPASVAARIVDGRVAVSLYASADCSGTSRVGNGPVWQQELGSCTLSALAIPKLGVFRLDGSLFDVDPQATNLPATERTMVTRPSTQMIDAARPDEAPFGWAAASGGGAADLGALNVNGTLWYKVPVHRPGSFRVSITRTCGEPSIASDYSNQIIVRYASASWNVPIDTEITCRVPGRVSQPLTEAFQDVSAGEQLSRGCMWIQVIILPPRVAGLGSAATEPMLLEQISFDWNLQTVAVHPGSITAASLAARWTPQQVEVAQVYATDGSPPMLLLEWNSSAPATAVTPAELRMTSSLQYRIVGTPGGSTAKPFSLDVPLELTRLKQSCNEFGIHLWDATPGVTYLFSVSLIGLRSSGPGAAPVPLSPTPDPATVSIAIPGGISPPARFRVAPASAVSSESVELSWTAGTGSSVAGHLVSFVCENSARTTSDGWRHGVVPVAAGITTLSLSGLASASTCRVTVAGMRPTPQSIVCAPLDNSSLLRLTEDGAFGMANLRSGCLLGLGSVEIGPSVSPPLEFSTACSPPLIPGNLRVLANGSSLELDWDLVGSADGYLVEQVSVEGGQTIASSFRRDVVSGSKHQVREDSFELHAETWFRVASTSPGGCEGPPTAWVSVAATAAAVTHISVAHALVGKTDALVSWECSLEAEALVGGEDVMSASWLAVIGPLDTLAFQWPAEACDGCGYDCAPPCGTALIPIDLWGRRQASVTVRGLLKDRMYMVQIHTDVRSNRSLTTRPHYVLMSEDVTQSSASSAGGASPAVTLVIVVVVVLISVVAIMWVMRTKAREAKNKQAGTTTSDLAATEATSAEQAEMQGLQAFKSSTVEFFIERFAHVIVGIDGGNEQQKARQLMTAALDSLEVPRDLVEMHKQIGDGRMGTVHVAVLYNDSYAVDLSHVAVRTMDGGELAESYVHATELLAEVVWARAWVSPVSPRVSRPACRPAHPHVVCSSAMLLG